MRNRYHSPSRQAATLWLGFFVTLLAILPSMNPGIAGEDRLWQTPDGSVSIVLPGDWEEIPPDDHSDRWGDGSRILLQLVHKSGAGFMSIHLLPDTLTSSDKHAMEGFLRYLCRDRGIKGERPQAFLIDGHTVAVAQGPRTKQGFREEFFAALTSLNRRPVLILFSTTGSAGQEVILQGQMALMNLALDEASFRPQTPPKFPQTAAAVTDSADLARPAVPFGNTTVEVRTIPGTGVTLVVPASFHHLLLSPGFITQDGSSHLRVSHSQLPMVLAAATLNRETLLRSGGNRNSHEEIEINGRPGYLALIDYKTTNGTMHEWRLVTGNDSRSVILSGTYPGEFTHPYKKQLKEAILSMVWDPGVEPNSLEGLDFAFSTGPRFRVASRAHDRVILNLPGGSIPVSREQTLVIIGRRCCFDPAMDPEALAKLMAFNCPLISEMEVLSTSEVRMGDRVGFELTGTIVDSAHGMKRDYYQALVMRGSAVYMVQGFQEPYSTEDVFDDFASIARSLYLH